MSEDKNIFDLHSLQAFHARNNIEIFESKKDSLKEDQSLIKDTLSVLHAYELFTCHIPPKNIIGAVKICRSEQQDKISLVRYFYIEETIFNEKFTKTKKLTEAQEFLKKFDKEMCYPTTDPLYALGGKTLPSLEETSFDFVSFRVPKPKSLFFKEAASTAPSKEKKDSEKTEINKSFIP